MPSISDDTDIGVGGYTSSNSSSHEGSSSSGSGSDEERAVLSPTASAPPTSHPHSRTGGLHSRNNMAACSSDDSDGETRPRRSSFSARFSPAFNPAAVPHASPRSAVTLPPPAAVPSAHSHRSPRPRVLVTGGAGFIGSHVARALLLRGDDVSLVDELNDYYDPALKVRNLQALLDEFGQRRVHIHVADICDEEAMRQAMVAEGCDRVVHLAARAGVRPSMAQPLLYQRTNVQGTTTLLQIAAESKKVSHFVYASSSSVYGDDAPAPFSEVHPCNNPVSVYAATKKSCEMLAASYATLHALPCSGLRFFSVYGEGGRRDMAPFIFVDKVARGLPLDMFGDGSSERDYTYCGDIVQGVLKVLDHPPGHTLPGTQPTTPQNPLHEVYNLGRGTPVRLLDFISTISTELGKPAIINRKPKQPGDVERTMADISKAQRMVGYEPQVSVEEGIRRTVAWYKREVLGREVTEAMTVAQAIAAAKALTETTSTRAAPLRPLIPAAHAFPPLSSCLCATRIHNSGQPHRRGLSPDVVAHLMSWLPRALAAAEFVAIAVDCTDQRQDIEQAVRALLAGALGPDGKDRSRVSVVCVAPWGAFCPALNALLAHAQSLRCESILYSSLEMAMHPAHVHTLAAHLLKDARQRDTTLVVGARLSGHRFVRGVAEIDGCSTVWNTLALWNCAKLARTGFLPVSDGVPARTVTEVDPATGLKAERVLSPAVASGVEEVACISTQQLLFPGTAQAKLLSMTFSSASEAVAPSVGGAQLNVSSSMGELSPSPSPMPVRDSLSASQSSSCVSLSDLDSPFPMSMVSPTASTSAASGSSEEADEDEEDECAWPASVGVMANTRVAEARRAPSSTQLAAHAQLYDDVATPHTGCTSGSQAGSGTSSALKRLSKQRTVSAPHAVSTSTSGCSVHVQSYRAPLARLHSASGSPVLASSSKHSLSVLDNACVLPPSAAAVASLSASPVLPSLFWDDDFSGDLARQEMHERKMRSKVERAAQQLAHMCIRPGTVQHIHCNITA